jgi:hypothetical protein
MGCDNEAEASKPEGVVGPPDTTPACERSRSVVKPHAVLFTLGRAAGGRDAWRDQLSRYRVVITGNTGGVEARVREPAQTPAP